jgi:hypothetical protein
MEAATALLIFGLCGLASVLVDADHFLSILLWKTVAPHITEGRILHTPIFILACVGVCYLVSRTTGLHSKLVLGAVITVTLTVLIYSPLVVWEW